jgi:hypothetical protein
MSVSAASVPQAETYQILLSARDGVRHADDVAVVVAHVAISRAHIGGRGDKLRAPVLGGSLQTPAIGLPDGRRLANRVHDQRSGGSRWTGCRGVTPGETPRLHVL